MFHAPTPSGQNEQSKQNEHTKQRDAFFDNAKYLAIVFVAMGTPGNRSRATAECRALYMVVYSFHMPAFILISGYFSRSFDMRPDRLKRLVTGVARAVRPLRDRVLALQEVGQRRPEPADQSARPAGISPGSWSRCSSGG
jgi:hypothetical protein